MPIPRNSSTDEQKGPEEEVVPSPIAQTELIPPEEITTEVQTEDAGPTDSDNE